LAFSLPIKSPVTGKRRAPIVGAKKAKHQIGMQLIQGRRCLRDLPASAFSHPVNLSAKGSSLLCRSGVVNCGSIVPAFKRIVKVLRDKPVRR
jgi:hypothetical protein